MTDYMTEFFSQDLANAALKAVIDPELGINIVDLGLVYGVEIDDKAHVKVTMTLTTPGCPLHASFAEEIEQVLWQSIPEITGVTVDLVWDPRWTPMMISAEGMEELGLA
ncbi:MAG TPA: metal-sulfur cluster assembly factor [Promineifilum sp.]|nr:metal-sulfur cluster assembly factor [Promineifilum sp.]HRO25376.1 metal-sulfur cluster assembly factor [Promineifilum sp.]HRQ14604.1 metal-sulfur cluster assembly factor [Promineifilum sp.]